MIDMAICIGRMVFLAWVCGYVPDRVAIKSMCRGLSNKG